MIDDDEWYDLRDEANEWAEKRSKYFRLSQKAYRNGDGQTAKTYSVEGTYCQKRMTEANEAAADAIFFRNNKSRPNGEIDLHGLYVHEAITKLTERVNYAINRGQEQLIVIVGQGHHSENGPKLKPAVIKFASENLVRYAINCPNRGCILLDLSEFIYSNSGNDSSRSSSSANTTYTQPTYSSSANTTYTQPTYSSSANTTYTQPTSKDPCSDSCVIFCLIALFLGVILLQWLSSK